MKTKLFTLVSSLILLSACSTQKLAIQSPIKEIQFGNGGGITGAVTTYTIKPDCTLWKNDNMLKNIPRDTIAAIFECAEQLPKQNYIHPDNIYSFVRIIQNDTTYYYVWSLGQTPDKKIINLYIKLNKQL